MGHLYDPVVDWRHFWVRHVIDIIVPPPPPSPPPKICCSFEQIKSNRWNHPEEHSFFYCKHDKSNKCQLVMLHFAWFDLIGV